MKNLLAKLFAACIPLLAIPINAQTAIQFDGTNDYVTMGTASSLGASSFTLECWFKRMGAGVTTSTGTGGVTAVPLVTKGRGEADGDNRDCNYFLGITTGGLLTADFEAYPATGITAGQNYPITASNTPIQNNTWYHAAVTYDGSTATWRLYLDGTQVGTSTAPAGALPRYDSIQRFAVGSALTSTGSAAGFFQGVIDEVRIWNVVRTQPQIAAAMIQEAPSSTTGLIGRYAFNEGTGTTTASAVSGGPAGTLTPSANPPTWVAGPVLDGNLPPIASITTPTNGATIFAHNAFTVEASASDPDGSVTQVEFLRNSVVVETVSNVPYEHNEPGLSPGIYTYAVRATDNLGKLTTSASVTVNVVFDPDNLPANAALRFDGVDDFVTMGTAPQLNAGGPPSNGFTVECWFLKEGAGATSSSGSGGVTGVPLFGKGRGEAESSNLDCNFFFAINNSGLLVADFEAYPATGITSGQNYPITGSHTPIENGTWYHAAAVYNVTTATWHLYLNGAPAGSTPVAAGALPRYDSIQHFAIATAMNSTGVREGAFAGRIDEVRVWNYARSAEDILATHDIELGAADGLIGRYGLNEATGATASNSSISGGAPLGTVSGNPVWVDGAPFGAPNNPPSVSVISPLSGTSSEFPDPVTLTATASDTDGTIVRVEFLVNGSLAGTVIEEPYTLDWTPAAEGTYTVAARAVDDRGASRTSDPITLIITPSNNLPPVVTMVAPANGMTGVNTSTTLSLSIADPEDDATTVTFYGRKTPPSIPGPDFVLGTLPDTQFYSENTGGNRAQIYHSQTQWFVDNRQALNLAFVSHMGDIVQNGDNGGNPSEWLIADAAMARIEDRTSTLLAYGIPWGGAPGNHDLQPVGDQNGAAVFYNQYFGTSRFAGRNYYGGNYGINNNNNYQLFSASGLDFIAIHLAYRSSTNTAILDWADALLKAHPNRRAIVTSHWIINTGNPATWGGWGQSIYDNLKDNPNLFLLLCGHVHGEGQRADTFEGRTVYSVLQDYQSRANGGDGWLRYFIFSPANNTITARTYSTKLLQYETDTDSQFTLPYNMQAPTIEWVALGSVNVPSGASTASFDWTGLETGAHYEWRATVTDSINAVDTETHKFSTIASSAPTVALTSPVNGASFGAPATVELTADASDIDGTIAKVEFYRGNIKIGEDTSAPYAFTWSGVAPGEYSLTAVAVDNSNSASLSAAIGILVGNTLPVVTLTAPASGVTYEAPVSIELTADASDSDGSIVKVEFYNGAAKLGEDTSAPYSFTLINAPSGSYSFTARAIDDFGSIATSSPAAVTVTNLINAAPSVSLTAPVNGAESYAGLTVALTANAADTDGTITKVEFFEGSNKLGEDTTSPYAFDWISVPAGNYTVTAIATDNNGAATTSTPVTIHVVVPPPGSFTYSQDFNSMGTSGTSSPAGWSMKLANSGSSNSTWTTSITANGSNSVASMTNITSALTATNAPSGTNNNGYNAGAPGDSANRMLATSPTSLAGVAIQLSLTNTSGTPITTLRIAYDIQRFTAPGTANELPGYWLYYSLDNGTSWTNLAALNPTISGASGVVVPNTIGVTSVPLTQFTMTSAWAPNSTLLFRWIDDNAVATSPDQIHGLDNVAISTVPVATPPSVSLTSPADNSIFDSPAAINLVASASVSTGSITKVEFFSGATKLGEDTSAPYEFFWGNVLTGDYEVTAVATDSNGSSATSTPVTISVINLANMAPAVALISPSASALIPAGSSLSINASASDNDGVIAKVEFFSGMSKLGEVTAPPYAITWNSVPEGDFELTALATDNDGGFTLSSPVAISAIPTNPVTLIAQGSNWKYLDNGSDQGSAWFAPAFNDSTWAQGAAELGYGDGDEATVVAFGSDTNNKHVTTYFRKAFEVSDALAVIGLTLHLIRDDGAIVYINGNEVARSNMTAGVTYLYNTFSPSPEVAGAAESQWFTHVVSPAALVTGTNTIAVEIHQQRAGSSDISFNLELIGQVVPPPQAPTVSITSPVDGSSYPSPATITITAEAADADGLIEVVEFYAGATKIGEAVNAPYVLTWPNVPAGNYQLTAVAIDDEGLAATSMAITVVVLDDYDNDGIPNDYEVAYDLDQADSADVNRDRDGDLASNWLEYALGTAANIPNRDGLPAISMGRGNDTRLTLSFNRLREALTYKVEASSDLNVFTVIATNPGTAGGMVSVTDDDTVSSNRYLRLHVTDGVNTATSLPQGRMTYTFNQNADTTVSFQLDEPLTGINGYPAGYISAVSTNAVADSLANWTPGQLSGGAPSLLRITSGMASGRTFPISTNPATPNTSDTLTLNTLGEDLTTLGIVSGSDTYELLAGDTLATLLPPGIVQSGTSMSADHFRLWNGSAWVVYYHDGIDWRRQGAGLANDVLVRPDQGWIVRRRGPTISVVSLGRAPSTNAAVPVRRGATSFISLLPIEQTFSGFSLQSRLANWSSNPTTPSSGDHVRIWNGSAWIVYYHDGISWIRQGAGIAESNVLLQPGRPIFVVRPAGSGSDVLTQPKSY